jgi:glycosyltransferase involved in cell wall biosynthesis
VVVLEAWDACKPVVATDAVSIINNFQDALLAYIQPESIAWCINRIISSPKEMKHLARAGWTRIERDFSWDHIAESTEKVYEQAIEQSR